MLLRDLSSFGGRADKCIEVGVILQREAREGVYIS